MAENKICPVCHTINAPGAEVCECGYQFRGGVALTDEALRQREKKKKLRSTLASFAVGAVVLALVLLTAIFGPKLGGLIILIWLGALVVSVAAVFIASKLTNISDAKKRRYK